MTLIDLKIRKKFKCYFIIKYYSITIFTYRLKLQEHHNSNSVNFPTLLDLSQMKYLAKY